MRSCTVIAVILVLHASLAFPNENERFLRGYRSQFPAFALSLLSQVGGFEGQEGIARVGASAGFQARFGASHTVSASLATIGEAGYEGGSFVSRWLPLELVEARYVFAAHRRPWVLRTGFGFQATNNKGLQGVEWSTVDRTEASHRANADFTISRVVDPVVVDAGIVGSIRLRDVAPVGLTDISVKGVVRVGVLLNADFLVYGQIDSAFLVFSSVPADLYRPAAAVGFRWAVSPRMTLGTDVIGVDGVNLRAEYEIVRVK